MEKRRISNALALNITSQTIVAYRYHTPPPYRAGNCFSVNTDQGANHEARIVNCHVENLEILLRGQVVTWPIKIKLIDGKYAMFCDRRIPEDWLLKQPCDICTPERILDALTR
jgi:hypothetical protein